MKAASKSDQEKKEQAKKIPVDFVLVKDDGESRGFLRQGVKSFATTILWTKGQEMQLATHLSSYVEGGKYMGLYAWSPPEFDRASFEREIAKSPEAECYFSVALTTAHVFFHTRYLGYDPIEGLKFAAPEKVYKVQRRKDFRLPIPDGYLIKMECAHPSDASATFTKKIFDISPGGMSVILDDVEDVLFHEGLFLTGISFRVRGRRIATDAEVRYMKPILFHARLKGIKMGMQFLNLDRKDYEFIKSYVNEESRKYFSKFY